jgi:hypothetical protein
VHGEYEVYSKLDSIISSESVPINDMLTGWDGSYQRGELAYADIEWSFGFASDFVVNGKALGRLNIQRQYRRYYYLSFDKETSDYYRALELGNKLDSEKKLDLTFKQFDAPGLSFGYGSEKFQLSNFGFQFGVEFSLYQPGHFQFGRLKGVAEAGEASAASGILDYRYDDDKLLDHQADVDKGLGLSFGTHFIVERASWSAKVEIKDLWNRFEWKNGAFTKGCINVGGGSNVQCDAQGAASGVSSQRKISETIPYTLNAGFSLREADIRVLGTVHDKYYRVGLEKGLQTSLGRFAFLLYYPQLVGVSWQTSIFNIELGADTPKFSQARNVQLNMGLNWRW